MPAVLSLPSFVPGLVVFFLVAWPLCVCGVVLSVFLLARLLVALYGCRAPFCGCSDPYVSIFFVWLLSARLPADCCFSSPCVAPWPSLHAGPSLWVSGCFVTAWLPCFIAGSVVVLCRPYFMLSHGSKGLWPCVAFFSLYHACVGGVLSITTLRYSSIVIQVPHLDTAKLHNCYSKAVSAACSAPVLCLPGTPSLACCGCVARWCPSLLLASSPALP